MNEGVEFTLRHLVMKFQSTKNIKNIPNFPESRGGRKSHTKEHHNLDQIGSDPSRVTGIVEVNRYNLHSFR